MFFEMRKTPSILNHLQSVPPFDFGECGGCKTRLKKKTTETDIVKHIPFLASIPFLIVRVNEPTEGNPGAISGPAPRRSEVSLGCPLDLIRVADTNTEATDGINGPLV